MVELRRMKPDEYKNEKTRRFIHRKNKEMENKILQHNTQNLEFLSLNTNINQNDSQDVIEKMMNKQVERTINSQSMRVKKGSDLYLERETADMKRVKQVFAGIRQKQKLALVDLVTS